jgi:hypothetical protein
VILFSFSKRVARYWLEVRVKCGVGEGGNIRDLYRCINDFKKGYQPRTLIVKDEKGDLIADSHSTMARWRNYFSQILNVRGLFRK